MDSKHLSKIAKQVTSELAPESVEILECNQYSGSVRVVSDHFDGMSLSDRLEILYELFYSQNGVPKTFLLEFQAWTLSENKKASKRGNSGNDSGAGGSSGSEEERKVALPPVTPP
jgi:hypothetical protein